MKLVVFAHRLDVGGAQINAIELAEAMRDLHGCDVVLFATPGPLLKVVHERSLQYRPAPVTGLWPSRPMIRALSEVVRRERPDVVHVWEWWQWLMSYYADSLLRKTPVIITDMGSEAVPRLLPKSLPQTFGTPAFVDHARAAGRRRAALLLPPVDVVLNAPEAADRSIFRDRYAVRDEEIAIVTVSRLAKAMKAESLRRTIEAVRAIARNLPVRFFIVGDGDARTDLESLAAETNEYVGRPAVVVTGELIDPRIAYAAADIVIGMGGSALRGMAFAKPVIIVGLEGFSTLFTPDTARGFYYGGFYGTGNGSQDALIADIRMLIQHPDKRLMLGKYSRQFVTEHFSLENVSTHLAALCHQAVTDIPSRYARAMDALRTGSLILGRPFVPDILRGMVKEQSKARTRPDMDVTGARGAHRA